MEPVELRSMPAEPAAAKTAEPRFGAEQPVSRFRAGRRLPGVEPLSQPSRPALIRRDLLIPHRQRPTEPMSLQSTDLRGGFVEVGNPVHLLPGLGLIRHVGSLLWALHSLLLLRLRRAMLLAADGAFLLLFMCVFFVVSSGWLELSKIPHVSPLAHGNGTRGYKPNIRRSLLATPALPWLDYWLRSLPICMPMNPGPQSHTRHGYPCPLGGCAIPLRPVQRRC